MVGWATMDTLEFRVNPWFQLSSKYPVLPRQEATPFPSNSLGTSVSGEVDLSFALYIQFAINHHHMIFNVCLASVLNDQFVVPHQSILIIVKLYILINRTSNKNNYSSNEPKIFPKLFNLWLLYLFLRRVFHYKWRLSGNGGSGLMVLRLEFKTVWFFCGLNIHIPPPSFSEGAQILFCSYGLQANSNM